MSLTGYSILSGGNPGLSDQIWTPEKSIPGIHEFQSNPEFPDHSEKGDPPSVFSNKRSLESDLKDHDTTREGLVQLCRNMLNYLHEDSNLQIWKNFLTDLQSNGQIPGDEIHPHLWKKPDLILQPTSSLTDKNYILIDPSSIPKETQSAEISSPQTQKKWILSVLIRDSFGFLTFQENPVTYTQVYQELEMTQTGILDVKFRNGPAPNVFVQN